MGNKQNIYFRQRTSINSVTPLYEACRDGNEEKVRNLLPEYSLVDLNRQQYPYGGNTCLHVATANGHENIVKLLLEHGCYRSSLLNSHNQSAYNLATSNKESIRLLFLRQDENDPSLKSSSRFYEQNASDCFDIVKVEDNPEETEERKKFEKRLSIQTYKTEEEQQHEIEHAASSKTMCQSRFGRFCVNLVHSDEPLDHQTIIRRLNHLLGQGYSANFGDYIKADDLMKQFEKNDNSIEQLLHLYTLETKFYRILRQDPLPLAIPLFMNLPKLRKRFFKGRVYRGMHMTYEQFLIYQVAMATPSTLLQTSSFSSTSMEQHIAEQFTYLKTKKNEKDICVLFIFDFPDISDQAINLSRLSIDTPCLSEYEDEKEVLILPWTLFEVTRLRKRTEEDDLYTVHLTNVIIEKKNLMSTFKWTWVELKNQLIRDKKIKLDYAFQKYKQ
jgi:hypothetical protein